MKQQSKNLLLTQCQEFWLLMLQVCSRDPGRIGWALGKRRVQKWLEVETEWTQCIIIDELNIKGFENPNCHLGVYGDFPKEPVTRREGWPVTSSHCCHFWACCHFCIPSRRAFSWSLNLANSYSCFKTQFQFHLQGPHEQSKTSCSLGYLPYLSKSPRWLLVMCLR